MLICCPECQFERTIDITQIPSSAVMATCPHCRCRFRFRNPDGTPTAEQNRLEAEQREQNAAADFPDVANGSPDRPETVGEDGSDVMDTAEAASPPGAYEHDDDDPLPPGAVIPRIPGDDDVDKELLDDNQESRRTADSSSDTTGLLKKAQGKLEKTESTPLLKGGLLKITKKLTGQSEQNAQTDSSVQNGQPSLLGKDKPGKLQEKAQQEIEQGVPWEQPRRYGPFMGMYQTILRVMFSAPRFFGGLPSSGPGLLRPLIFYLLLGVFQTLVERTWYLMRLQAAEPSITDPQVQEMIANITQSMSLPLTLLLSPVFLAMQLCFFASVFFLMLRLVHPEKAHFRTVFKVIAYSAAPTLVCVIPLVGPIVGSIWFGVSCFAGCKYALRLPWARTALALGPLYLVALAIGLQIVRQFMAG